ncbi:hypothetical protein RUM43_002322 [Polyplax serrata]|uniref:Protein sleepless n=1 Tax=Polyplax serrata TaxID=468196 RepID=A0AAN8S4N9_POLSC
MSGMSGTINGELQVERSCAWEQAYDNNRPCSSVRSSPYSVVEHCSTCNTDACNAAFSMNAGMRVLPITMLVYLGAKYL